MNKQINLSEFDIDLILNILSNCHDWDVNNFKDEITWLLVNESNNITFEIANVIYQKWEQIPSEEKFKPCFNLRNFFLEFITVED